MKIIPLLAFLSLLTIDIKSQSISVAESYHDILEGIYELKSLDKKFNTQKVIEPQKLARQLNRSIEYISLEGHEITLFSTSNPIDVNDIAGKLIENSLVQVLGKEYRRIYKDPNSEWKVTFEVWNKVLINGTEYYTDFKLHNFLAFQTKLPKLDQTFVLFGQNDGYDFNYDTGYPEHFNVLIFDSSNKLIFESGKLDLLYGDEFWETDVPFGSLTHESSEAGMSFTIKGIDKDAYKQREWKDKNYSFHWDGKNLHETGRNK